MSTSFSSGGGDDTVLGDNNANLIETYAGDDVLSGRSGTDTLIGGLGSDTLDGGAGNDVLQGDQDNDTLIGGAGNDLMEGGSGADAFEFNAGDGIDLISDFNVGQDMLVLLGGLSIAGLSEAELGGETGPDTLVTLSTGDTITLLDVSGVSDPLDLF